MVGKSGSLPYKFRCLDLDSYELRFLIRIDDSIMRSAFKVSVMAHAKKTGVDIDSAHGPKINSFDAPVRMFNIVGTGMTSFWKSASKNILFNSGGRVKLVSRRVFNVSYERQSDNNWACLVVFRGEYVDGRGGC